MASHGSKPTPPFRGTGGRRIFSLSSFLVPFFLFIELIVTILSVNDVRRVAVFIGEPIFV
jgi:hypothetical protein